MKFIKLIFWACCFLPSFIKEPICFDNVFLFSNNISSEVLSSFFSLNKTAISTSLFSLKYSLPKEPKIQIPSAFLKNFFIILSGCCFPEEKQRQYTKKHKGRINGHNQREGTICGSEQRDR